MRRNIWIPIMGLASMMWLLQTPIRTYGQSGSNAASQSPAASAPVAPSSASDGRTSGDCDCSQSETRTFGPLSFGGMTLGPMALSASAFGAQFDRKKIDSEVREALENARHEIETAMQSEDWQKLSDLPDLHELQAELRETVPQALQEAERKVIEITPMDTDEDAGWLGVEIAEITAEQAKQFKLPEMRGVVVISVEADSPAAKAGIKEKDVILSFGDEKVEGVVQFRRLVRETPPGREIRLNVSRDGNVQNVPVSIASRQQQFSTQEEPWGRVHTLPALPPLPNMPNADQNFMYIAPEAMEFRTPMLGISAEDLSGQLGAYFGTPNGEGVLVRDVKSGSAAENAGLHAGDVIVKLDDKTVRNLRELRTDLREKSDQKTVQLSLLRKGSSLSVTIPIEKPRPIEVPAPVHRAQL